MRFYRYYAWALLLLVGSIWPAAAADETPPIIAQVQPAPGTVTSLSQVTVRFSEHITGIASADLLLNGQPAGTVVGEEDAYTFHFTQPAYGTVQMTWDGNHTIADLAGNRFNETAAGARWTYTLIDTAAPVVATLSPAAGITVNQLTQIEVHFSEPVIGIDAADLIVNSASATNITVLGAGRYLFRFPAQPAGTVQVGWAGNHQIRDFASPANAFAGGAWSYTVDPNSGVPDIRISEFLASNVNGLRDENNEAEDWIEIENRGSTTVDLGGWSLTDDPDDPGRWVFPSTNIAPGQFLVVFASAKDRRTGTRLHTNFKLSPFGDYLGLFNAESPRVAVSAFAPEYPEQRNDHSYGIDATGALRYFSTPTPGAPNGTSQISGVVEPPHFNVERGIFETPFKLYLSSITPGATIRFTTDGSEPTASIGTVYTGPMEITNTTAIRAIATKLNMLPSVTVTHTYLFLEQVVRQPNSPAGFPTNWGFGTNIQDVGTTLFSPASTTPGLVPADYEMDMDPLRANPNDTNSPIDAVKLQRLKDGLRELPTISIVMNVDDLFGVRGLYQRSADETGSPGTKPQNKKPCSVEMILPDGTTAFTTTCAIDLHGNASRNPVKNPKHGFKLTFRGEYGPPTLEYPLFEDSAVREYDDVLLRPDFNSSWRHWSDTAGQGLGAFQRTRATRTRDAWMKSAMRDMGGLTSHSRFCHLYLNGLYWGTFDLSEDPTEVFAKNNLGGTEEDFDVIDQGVLKKGTRTFYDAMVALPAATTLAQYEQYHQYLNVTEFADYMLLHFFIGHQDWATEPNKNWNAIRKRVPGPEGTFRYIPWDGECILLNDNVNRTTVTGANFPSGLHGDLDDSPEYRLLFADRVHRHMIASDGALARDANIARWQKWQAVMDKPIVAESVRWGDYRRDVHRYQEGTYQLYTREEFWLPENARMLTYFSNRSDIVLGQLRAANLYPSVSAPVLNQHGGRVARNFNLSMTATNPIYYTLDGADPREYGTGAIRPAAQTYSGPISLSNSVIVKARALLNTNWSALVDVTFQVAELALPLRITEIMYNPVGGDAYEFIELRNAGSLSINIGLYSFSGITFTFPPNTALAPGATIVLASDASPGNWAARYPGVTVFGYFDGSLSNGGEKIALHDPNGNVVYSLDYNDENGWPKEADGSGQSLSVNDIFGDPDAPSNWHAAAPSPGASSVPPPGGPVVLNEVMADNASAVSHSGTYPDWVELHNASGASADVSGWSLTDDDNARKFVFPPGTIIPANGYLVVWCDTNATPGLHSGFALGRNGETVVLYNAAATRVDTVTFGLQVADHSVGRVNGSWQLTSPTPNAPNAAVTLGSSTNLVINEWLADPAPGAGDDWVELYNRSDAPVALNGIFLSDGKSISAVQSLSFVPPLGFAVLFANEGSGPDELDFRLPASGGTIILYDDAAIERDRIRYGQQTEGVTQGRLPDGAATITSFLGSASPRANNYVLVYNGPIINEVLAVNDYAYTNAYRATSDWIELHNPSGAAFDLSGMQLNDEPSAQGAWVFPTGTSIPANGYLIVLFDDSRPVTVFAGPVLNTSKSLDGESGEIYLLNSSGQVVDSVVYGFQIADLPIGRSGGQWRLLQSATPGSANSAPVALSNASGLRLNEWMADPLEGNDWFEIYNSASQPVALEGIFVSDTPSLAGLNKFQFAGLSFIAAQGFVRVIADEDPGDGRNHVNFALAAEGESLRLLAPALGLIDAVDFGPQSPGVSEGRLPDGGTLLTQFPETATPAAANYTPLQNIFVNETLVNTAAVPPAIELYNANGFSVDVGGWYLGDARDARRFRLPPGTILPAGGYLVRYESQFQFQLDPARGGQVFLSEADAAGHLSGLRAAATYGACESGTAFGRHKTSAGHDFVQLTTSTLEAHNASPRVGPIVISEIMYRPALLGTNENTQDEYVEIHNPTGSPIMLSDPAGSGRAWRLREGARFSFPTNLTIPAGGYILVVGFDPGNFLQLAAFRNRIGVGQDVEILGPFDGNLANEGESIALERPGTAFGNGVLPNILVERITYGHAAPWPESGYGDGSSLQRLVALDYGNEPLNWQAAPPSAGRANAAAPLRAPVIVAQPVSRTVPDGSRVEFSAGAVGSAPLSYQWTFNGANIPGATSSAYVISSASAANTGSYRVSVSNDAGSTLSDNATLAIGSAPTITQQPQGTTVPTQSDVTLSVGASGAGPLTYQWRLNGQDIPGANSSELVLANVRRDQTGDYSVVVGNTAGMVASAIAHVEIFQRVQILAHPQPRAVATGASASFSVNATGTGTLRYQWLNQGQPISGAIGSTLTINNVQIWDSGDYAVVVSDDRSSATSQPATLTVTGVRPVFTKHPASKTVAVGEDVTLDVTVYGSWPLTNRWRRASANVVTNILPARQTNDSYTLLNVQTNHAALYSVGAIALGGQNALSSNAFITVVIPPVDQTASVGSNASLNVTAASPQPANTNLVRFQWQRNGTNLLGATNATLALNNVQSTDDGLYSVVVTLTNNLPAPASFSAFLTVVGPDTDSDGMPDDWEIANNLDHTTANGGGDADGDTMTNLEEYLAATDPQDEQSYLKIEIQAAGTNLLRFHAKARKSYTIETSDSVTGPWTRLIDVSAAATDQVVEVPHTFTGERRFYQLRTPKRP